MSSDFKGRILLLYIAKESISVVFFPFFLRTHLHNISIFHYSKTSYLTKSLSSNKHFVIILTVITTLQQFSMKIKYNPAFDLKWLSKVQNYVYSKCWLRDVNCSALLHTLYVFWAGGLIIETIELSWVEFLY